MTNIKLWLLGLIISSAVGFAIRRVWKWYRSQRQVLPTGTQTVFVESNGREVEILLDPRVARKAHKVNKRRLWAMFSVLFVRLIARRGRIWLAVADARAMTEIVRVETPGYVPPAPASEQLLWRLDQALEFFATRLAHLLRNRWAERQPIRDARAANRQMDIADATAEITERGETSLWHSRKLWNKVGMGLLIIVTAFLLSKKYWLPGGGLVALTLVLGIILWRRNRQRRERLTQPETEVEVTTNEPDAKTVHALAVSLLLAGLFGLLWFGWLVAYPVLSLAHTLCFALVWRRSVKFHKAQNKGDLARGFTAFGLVFPLAVWLIVCGATYREVVKWQTKTAIAKAEEAATLGSSNDSSPKNRESALSGELSAPAEDSPSPLPSPATTASPSPEQK